MLLRVLLVAWPVAEIVLGVVKRAGRGSASVRDRGSLALLWAVIGASVTAAAFLQFVPFGRMGLPGGVLRWVAVGLLVAGLALRWWAILTLGRLFNTNVAIRTDHRVVRRGPYRHVRHPSYSGLLLAFAGLGVSFGSWLSLGVILVPVLAAVLYRIGVEESALVEALGEQYGRYCDATKRLIPLVY